MALGIKVRSDDRHRANGPLFPTKEELKLLIDRAPDRWWPYIVIAIFTGMRASEIRGLRWCDVDLEDATIRVTQRADAWGKMGSPKSAAGTRDIPLGAAGGQHVEAMEATMSGGDLVFPNPRGGVIAYSTSSHLSGNHC